MPGGTGGARSDTVAGVDGPLFTTGPLELTRAARDEGHEILAIEPDGEVHVVMIRRG